jgi:hypothetical protein
MGELVHILHDDDIVTPEFYGVILALHRRFPSAALYCTGSAPVDAEDPTAGNEVEEPLLLEGDDAAAFILEDARYSVGSVVLSRDVVASKGLFRGDFPYSPDEEAFPRYATDGGIAFDPAPCYRVRTHEQQARYSTWRRSDFVASYVRSRVEGATGFSPAIVDLALKSSARRVISIAVSLALDGQDDVARCRLADLGRIVPSSRRWPRFWLAQAAGRSQLLRKMAGVRRRYIVRQRTVLGRQVDLRRRRSAE